MESEQGRISLGRKLGLDMVYQDDRQSRIQALQERRKLLIILISEYRDRLKYDQLRGDELDRSTQELAALQAEIQSIDTALVENENEPGIESPQIPSA